ncbi:hypothetical protein ACFSTC_61905 [Nonomuraea ferruginea]
MIITGLPGAGKSTLLGRLYPLTGAESSPVRAGGATVADSMQSRLRWAAALAWAPKPVRTAVVFVTHIRRIRAALGRGESVVAHNRGCGPLVLRGFARLARRAGCGLPSGDPGRARRRGDGGPARQGPGRPLAHVRPSPAPLRGAARPRPGRRPGPGGHGPGAGPGDRRAAGGHQIRVMRTASAIT